MSAYVAEAIAECESTHVLEEKLWRHLLRIGHSLVEGFIRAHGDGDVGETLELAGKRSRLGDMQRPLA